MTRSLAMVALMLLILGAEGIHGQQPSGQTVRTVVLDSTMRDSLKKDSTKARELVKWAEADSVMQALIKREGYTATRYQGDRVVFDAGTRTIYLEGEPGAVNRDQTIIVGDTITYNDSTQVVFVRGDTVVLRDPAQNAADIIARGSLTYNVASRRGTVSNVATAIESGEEWFVQGARAGFVSDTATKQTRFYARDGIITSCDHLIPDYYFRSKEIKVVSKNLMVGRPAVLYVAGVPIMWMPFIFQDMRAGRRSGVLTPRFGVSEIFRNSPTYRRHIENFGYYFAISDYMDAQVALDWRSGARPAEGDPGWTRINGEWRYRWLNRFLTGRIGASHLSQRDGTTNTAISWGHQQDFSQTSRFNANINYVTSTVIQRRTTFDPRQVLATIASQANYQQKVGPFGFSVGGSRTQYPGRQQIDQDFPNVNMSSPTIAITNWLEWTPSFSLANRQNLNIDQLGEFSFRYSNRADGTLDSARVNRDARSTSISFGTPLRIGKFTWQNSFSVSDVENNFPESRIIVDPVDTSLRSTRVFAKTFSTQIDWSTSINLPSMLAGTLKLSPSISIVNVDPSGFWIRSEQTGGRYVQQSKRLVYGLSASPTFFGLFPGFGPVSRFRHSVNPFFSFDYAPSATVSDEFLRALNRTRGDYLGSLAQNRVSFRLSQTVEARLKSSDTLSTEGAVSMDQSEARKIKILSLNFSPLVYDFERARVTKRSGLATEEFSYDLSSDLLPGFSTRVNYSLFQGSSLSDTAIFKPYRTSIDASFSVNRQSGIFAAFNRIFGRAVPHTAPRIERLEPSDDDALAERAASEPVAGSYIRNRSYEPIQSSNGWQGSFTFSSTRQRAPVGGNIVEYDPNQICEPYRANPLEYNQCLIAQATAPTSALPFTPTSAGAPFVRVPPRETLNSQMRFNITPTWSASWSTLYDFQEKAFASQSVNLQRDLHDWRAVFAFTRAPNGNFAFNFYITLKANSDIKFDYDKQTYRPLN